MKCWDIQSEIFNWKECSQCTNIPVPNRNFYRHPDRREGSFE
jgi:hypothetical protein